MSNAKQPDGEASASHNLINYLVKVCLNSLPNASISFDIGKRRGAAKFIRLSRAIQIKQSFVSTPIEDKRRESYGYAPPPPPPPHPTLLSFKTFFKETSASYSVTTRAFE